MRERTSRECSACPWCSYRTAAIQWAISTPIEKQTCAKALVDKAVGYGIHGVRVDGNDVLAVYLAVRDAAARGRKGEGPTLVECVSYRPREHATSD